MGEEHEYEGIRSREEVADVFESFARELRGDGPITLAITGGQVTVDPPAELEFEVEVEEETSRLGSDEGSIEFELEWG
ncbi:amphi-Trp domain-containing protein [Halobacteriales archaeon QS_4_69_34]|jgi:amphi-Trp domain-containing protein|nr:MAG: amphi-Trp domain-containing protein [Halobacteriales archaeon QS_4_69_34]